jgi:hypothetical protein
VARQELLLVLVGGVFVAEAGSVILQVASHRWRRRRIFLCAPLHHHYQLKGWAENKIVVRFWIAAAICALVGVASLKVNVRQDAREMAGPRTSSFPRSAWERNPGRSASLERPENTDARTDSCDAERRNARVPTETVGTR